MWVSARAPSPALAPGIGTAGPGGTIVQTGGTVELTGGGDLVTMGLQRRGCLQAPRRLLKYSQYELRAGRWRNIASGFTSTYNQTGGLANVYGLSMGTTQAFGVQPGNGDDYRDGRHAQSWRRRDQRGRRRNAHRHVGQRHHRCRRAWSTSQPITLNNSTTATFNTSGGNITLAGAIDRRRRVDGRRRRHAPVG